MSIAELQKPIARKFCNALIKEAKTTEEVSRMMRAESRAVVALTRRLGGGLWVGGACYLTDSLLVFEPNSLNSMMHESDCSFSIPLSDIVKTERRFGVLTGIIDIHTAHKQYSLRMFNANGFRKLLESTRLGISKTVHSS